MPVPNFAATVDHFSSRLAAAHTALARAWLERLDELLSVEARDVFPTHQLLDHIPDLLKEISGYLRAPADQEIAANTAVMAKAAELGLLRFDQRASVHQLLREYQILSEILEAFFAREAALLGERGDATAAVLVVSRAQQAVRVLQQKTVDAFITRYTETIERQTAQLRNFSRLVSHEIRQPLGVLQVLARVLSAVAVCPRPPRLRARPPFPPAPPPFSASRSSAPFVSERSATATARGRSALSPPSAACRERRLLFRAGGGSACSGRSRSTCGSRSPSTGSSGLRMRDLVGKGLTGPFSRGLPRPSSRVIPN
jgi:signal transduction histidine kinase